MEKTRDQGMMGLGIWMWPRNLDVMLLEGIQLSRSSFKSTKATITRRNPKEGRAGEETNQEAIAEVCDGDDGGSDQKWKVEIHISFTQCIIFTLKYQTYLENPRSYILKHLPCELLIIYSKSCFFLVFLSV